MTSCGPTTAGPAARADVALRRDVLGPTIRLRLVLRTRLACYLADDTGPRVGVVDAAGIVMPSSMLLPAGLSWEWLLHDHLRAGAAVLLGEGVLRCGERRMAVYPELDLRLPPLPWNVARVGHAIERLDRALAAVRDDGDDLPWPGDGWPVAPPHGRLDPGATLDRLMPAAVHLVGRGPGVTPSGDDVLAATLLVHTAAGTPDAERVGHALAGYATDRTTAAAVLQYRGAARGCASRPLWSALVALLTRADPTPQLAALFAVGHSSGRDLARGLRAGLAAVHERLLAAEDRSVPAARHSRPTERNHA